MAIAVFDDEEWSRFVDAIGRPAWTADERFATQQSRWENQDALDEAVATWTSQRDRYEATKLLQAAGVPAGAVQNAEDLNETDPQLAHRGVFFEMDHPVIGEPGSRASPSTSTACRRTTGDRPRCSARTTSTCSRSSSAWPMTSSRSSLQPE